MGCSLEASFGQELQTPIFRKNPTQLDIPPAILVPFQNQNLAITLQASSNLLFYSNCVLER